MLRVLLIGTLAIVLIVGLGAVYFYRRLDSNLTTINISQQLDQTTNEELEEKVEPDKPMNILIMGSDTRDTDEGVDQMQNGGARSDTTILMHLSADRKSAYGVSIARDLLVDRPECKTADGTEVPAEENAMFNSAYFYGGVPCTIKTVRKLTGGVPINHWVVVNFNGFKDMVDAIGGVNVCIPTDIDDPERDMFLKAGTRKISGDEALTYVRVRHGFGDGSDIGRMKRQQAFVASMAAQVVSAGTLTRVDKVVRFLDAATKSLALDDGIGSVLELARVGNSFRSIGLDNIQFVTAPIETSSLDVNRLQLKQPDAQRLFDHMKADEPLGKSAKKQSISAGDEQKRKDKGDSGSGDSSEAEANGLCG